MYVYVRRPYACRAYVCLISPASPSPLFAACGYNEHEPSSAKNFFFRRKAIMYCTYTLHTGSCHAAQPPAPITIHIRIFVSRFGYRGGFLIFPNRAPRVAKKWLVLCTIGWGWGFGSVRLVLTVVLRRKTEM